MSAEPVVPEAHVAYSHAVARAAGITVVVIAATVICGWAFDVRWLSSFSRTGGPMKLNTAVAGAALGLSVTLLGARAPGRQARLTGSVLAAGAVAVALTNAAEYVSGGFPHIDEILIHDRYAAGYEPGRMAVNTAVGLTLIGSGLLLRAAAFRTVRRLGELCLIVAGMVVLLAAVGHLYGVPTLTSTRHHTVAIAIPTVLILLIATGGALAARPEAGVMAVVLGRHAGGVAARRLLPVAVGVPLILGWLRHVGERRGLIEAQFGTAVLVVATAMCLAALVIRLAVLLNRSDIQARLADELRTEVEVRTAAQAATAAANDELSRHNDLLARSNRALDRANADLGRLAAIVRSSDDAIIASDLDGTITAWNPGAELLYGYPAGEAVGMPVFRLARPEDEAALRDLIVRIGRGEHIERYEAERVCKDGSAVDVSVHVAPLLDETGAVTGVSLLAHDITSERAAQAREQALRERSQTAERLESLGQLAGGVAHDFNNVLAIILNYATFITEQTPPDDPVHADAAQITTSAQRAASLADQLMVFARKEPAKVDVFDLNATVGEVRSLLERTIGEHIRMITRAAAFPLPMQADHARIQQVLLNLALNARDAMPAGGTLVLEAKPFDLDDPLAGQTLGLDAGRYARVLVSDTGTGMPPAVAARVFEPFFTTKPKGRGTGLGLATAYGTVTQLGGTIRIYSEPDVGTTMSVYLPLVEQPDAAAPAEPPAEPPRGTGQTILAVDDEADIRQLLARILDANGYTVVIAESGPHALNLVAQHAVDLLLTDVIMPGMNGRELADTLLGRHPGMPVVYMSGYCDGLLSAERLLADDVNLIQKPFTARELLHTVHNLLTRMPTTTT